MSPWSGPDPRGPTSPLVRWFHGPWSGGHGIHSNQPGNRILVERPFHAGPNAIPAHCVLPCFHDSLPWIALFLFSYFYLFIYIFYFWPQSGFLQIDSRIGMATMRPQSTFLSESFGSVIHCILGLWFSIIDVPLLLTILMWFWKEHRTWDLMYLVVGLINPERVAYYGKLGMMYVDLFFLTEETEVVAWYCP